LGHFFFLLVEFAEGILTIELLKIECNMPKSIGNPRMPISYQNSQNLIRLPRLHQTSPRLRLAGQSKLKKTCDSRKELLESGEVCPPKSLDRHSFSGGG